jgi:hypothetical protein
MKLLRGSMSLENKSLSFLRAYDIFPDHGQEPYHRFYGGNC